MANHHTGQNPSTPPGAVHQSVNRNRDPPPAPRHVTRGRLDENYRTRSAGSSPREDRETSSTSIDTSTMDRAVQDSEYHPPTRFSNPPSGRRPRAPVWRGPQAVSGQVASLDDPFVSGNLTASAPAFVPARNIRQSASLGAGSSSSPDSGPADAGSSHGPSSNNDISHGTPANMTGGSSADGGSPNGSSSDGGTSHGSSANTSSGGDASVPGDDQSSDSPDPVIVTTPHPGGNGPHDFEYDPPAFVITRFLRVDNVYAAHFEENQPLGMIKALPMFKELVQKLGVFSIKPSATGGQMMLLFVDSLHGAKSLYDMLKMTHHVQYITCETFRAAKVNIPETIDRLSADVDFTVSIKGRSRARRFNEAVVVDMAKGAAAKFGMILHFELVDNSDFVAGGRLRFRIEYNSVGDANDAVHATNPADGVTLPFGTHEHLLLNARGYEPVDINSPAGQASESPQMSPSRRNGSASSEPPRYSTTGRTGMRKSANGKSDYVVGPVVPNKIAAPSHPTQPMVPDSQHAAAHTIYAAANPTAGILMLGPDGREHPGAAKPQDVCEWRIVNGYDVRTTLMVRNVPPEMTGADFVKMLNLTVPGEFDFAYNRIDFQKSQSVGYAFVNFIDTEPLLRFVRAWRGKLLPHNIYRQHLRPCAVSYANTQGWDCLVAKFRNSSILDEAKPCRPLLFWTVLSAANSPELIGQEREWPEVDNVSKKSRSVENAKISGLYTPRPRVNGGRGGARRGGHTRFDRGTPAQQHEESQMGSANYQHGAGPAPVYGPYAQPRFQGPPMLYDWQSSQLVPPQVMGYPPMPFPMQPMMQPSPVQSSALRTHTHGDLGYRHPVMPGQLAPVNDPSQIEAANQDDFQPLLYPIKGQVPEYYRLV